MIKCEKEKGTVEFGGGSEIDIAFEFVSIVGAMKEFLTDDCGDSKEVAESKINDFVKIGLMTEDEVDKEVEAAKQKIVNGIAEFVTKLLFGGKPE